MFSKLLSCSKLVQFVGPLIQGGPARSEFEKHDGQIQDDGEDTMKHVSSYEDLLEADKCEKVGSAYIDKFGNVITVNSFSPTLFPEGTEVPEATTDEPEADVTDEVKTEVETREEGVQKMANFTVRDAALKVAGEYAKNGKNKEAAFDAGFIVVIAELLVPLIQAFQDCMGAEDVPAEAKNPKIWNKVAMRMKVRRELGIREFRKNGEEICEAIWEAASKAKPEEIQALYEQV